MDEQPTTNPAERLITILRRALSADPEQTFLGMWRYTLRKPGVEVSAIYEFIGLLQGLATEIERGIKAIPDLRHEVYLKFLPELRTILARENLQEGWRRHKTAIEMIVNSLRFASERLQEHSPEPTLPQSELNDLLGQVREMMDALGKSTTIPRSLKVLLFELVAAIERSINEYRFRGIRSVRQQLFVVASLIQEHLPEFEQSKDVPEVKQFWQFLKKVDSATATALRVKELISSVVPMLGQALPALLEHVAR